MIIDFSIIDIDFIEFIDNSFSYRFSNGNQRALWSQLMDDLDLINSVEQVEAMVNSIQKGVLENVLRK